MLCISVILTVLFAGMAVSYADGKLPAPKPTIDTVESSGKPRMKWDAVKGAVKYETYRAASKNGTYKRMAVGTSTKYTNTSSTPGKTYYYKVRAVDKNGNKGTFSSVKSITCACARPEVSIANRSSDGKPRLTWKKVEGASKYEIYRATSKNGTYKLLKTTEGTSFTNTGAKEGVTYYYKVKAICGASKNGNSAFSAVKSGSMASVKLEPEFTVNQTTGKPTATWSPVAGAVKYEVYRATSKNGKYSRMSAAASTKYTNTSAEPGKTYYYKVRTVDKNGKKGSFSSVKSVTCICPQPVVTLTLRSSDGKPTVTWKAVKGASKYEIYGSASKNGKYSLLKTTEGKSYVHTSAAAGKAYYYKIRAICGVSKNGNSVYSVLKGIKCGGAASSVPEKPAEPAKPVEPETAELIGTAVCTAKESMNLRGGPGTGYAKTGTLKSGAKVEVFDEKNGWYMIKLSSKYHWASGDYLKVTLKGEQQDTTRKYDVFPIAKNTKLKGKVVILDPGHGTGAGGAYKDYAENVYNLKHAKLVKQSLENSGAKVIMTRSDNTNVDNYARVSMANKYTLQVLKTNKQSEYDKLKASGTASDDKLKSLQAEIAEFDRLIAVMQSVISNPKLSDTYYLSPYDEAIGRPIHADLKKIFELQKSSLLKNVIYVSIHSNATGDGSTSTNGTVTFYMDNEINNKYYTGYQTAKNKKLATELCNEVVAAGGYAKRGIKVNDYFMVRETNIPSALLEIGFHTNAKDREKLMNASVQKRVANAVTYAIMDYFN